MAQIYVKDHLHHFYGNQDDVDTTSSNSSGSQIKKSIADILPILKEIGPNYITDRSFRAVPQGFIVTYNKDNDVDFIFNPENISKLQDKNISVELSNPSKNLREAFIGYVPEQIFNLPAAQILSELRKEAQTQIVHIKKFHVVKSGSTVNYLVITSSTSEHRKQVAGKFFTLFGYQIFIAAKRPSRAGGIRSSHQGSGHQSSNPKTRSVTTTGSPPSRQSALGSGSVWGGPRYSVPSSHERQSNHRSNSGGLVNLRQYLSTQPPQPSQSASISAVSPPSSRYNLPHTPAPQQQQQRQLELNSPLPQRPPRPQRRRGLHQQPQQSELANHHRQSHLQERQHHSTHHQHSHHVEQQCTERQQPQASQQAQQSCPHPQEPNDLKRIIEVNVQISKTLSVGLERPKCFLAIFNLIQSHQGLPKASVPIEALELSRAIHERNKAKISPRSQPQE